MIVVHIESGLGNQMLSFCEYIALKKINPESDIFIETIVYDIPECNDTICQWNGYELERVFGIKSHNIKEKYSEDEWVHVLEEVRHSRFWEKNWNYPVYITNALNRYGLNLVNIRGNFEKQENQKKWARGWIGNLRESFTQKTKIGNYIRRKITGHCCKDLNDKALQNQLFFVPKCDIFTGQRLSFKLNGAGIDLIKDEVINAFKFPVFTTERNIKFASFLESTNSVFIHARRGDMLAANGWCYRYGYFRRAVGYIKKHVKDPVFVFFTDTGSIDWCKENAKIFNLDYCLDKVLFVDWNLGEDSYRDMQLMSHCKHGIITNSTFGWWGAYFIKNPEKITISPLAGINTTYHC